jgi:hypothetical protein
MEEKKHMPGVKEVGSLIDELVEEYHVACWNMRNAFAHGPKKFLVRVNISEHKKAPSPLLQEVQPEDISDVKAKAWTEMVKQDYDGDYVASTDPLHPVSTDYKHPMDDDDGSWVLKHLSREELELGEDTVIDFDSNQWSWSNNDSSTAEGTERTEENSELHAGMSDDTVQELVMGLVAWGPDAPAISSSAVINMSGLHQTAETEFDEQIQEVMSAFWAVVNEDDRHTLNSELYALLQKLNINYESSSSSSFLASPTPTSAPSTPPGTPPGIPPSTLPGTPPLPWTDGPSDALHQRQPSISSTFSSPFSTSLPPPIPIPIPNATKSPYDKHRKFLQLRKHSYANVSTYYSDWLIMSRNVIRALEGAEGRYIPDPAPMV